MNNEPQQLHPGDVPYFQINKLVPFDDVKDMAVTPDLEQPGFTQRQIAAIELRVPDSGLAWLDEMILESRRMDLAGQALAGYLADTRCPDKATPSTVAQWCYSNADAMIAARKGGQQ